MDDLIFQIISVIKLANPVLVFLMIVLPYIINDKWKLMTCLKAKTGLTIAKAHATGIVSLVISVVAVSLNYVTVADALISFAVANLVYAMAVKMLIDKLKSE